jgi:hypothetical protein
MVLFSDALTLDAPRRTADGYLAVRAKAARTGTYAYLGSEIDPENKHGLRDAGMVNVLRDDSAVFDSKSAHSFIGKPVTDNHPREAVNSTNWRDHARGVVMGAMRDGEYLAFDLLLTDASAIAAVNGGKRELSNGYAADLQFGDFAAADGTKCVARQKSITGNHVAIVDRGRAGPSCRIGDAAICDALPIALQDGAKEAAAWLKKAIALHEKHMNGSAPTTGKEGEKSQMLMMEQMKNALSELESDPSEKPMKMDALVYGENTMKIKIGDAEVDATNGEAVRIANDAREGAFKELQTKVGTLTADLATANTDIQTKDGEIAALTAKLADAEVTPAKLQQLADARADVIAKAKTLAPSLATDGKTDAEIRKAAVTAKLGDAAKDMADAAIEGAFIAFTKDAKPADPLRTALSDGLRTPADARSVVSTIRAARYA